jgi:hypothetical protein
VLPLGKKYYFGGAYEYRTCSTHGKEDEVYRVSLVGKRSLGRSRLGRIILKWIFGVLGSGFR